MVDEGPLVCEADPEEENACYPPPNQSLAKPWTCDASCNVEGKEPQCTGRVTGSATGPSEEEAQASAYALGLIGDPGAVQPLIGVLTDVGEAASVRGMAAEALADLGDPKAASHLIDALASPAAEVRFWAAFALRRLGTADAVAPLQRLAESDQAEIPGHGTVGEEAAAAVRSIQAREARSNDD